MIEVRTRPTRNAWLHELYEHGLIRADEYSLKLADKLFFGRALEAALGEKAHAYYPKTRGLRELFERYGSLETAMLAEFPRGFIIKPVGEVNSGGETLGFYFNPLDFWADLQALRDGAPRTPRLDVLHSALYDHTWISPDLGSFTTGERLIAQSDLGLELAGQASLKSRQFDEIRIHTFGDVAIDGGDFHRWKINPVLEPVKFRYALEFTNRFLKLLPRAMTERQAWSLDLFVMGEDRVRILDVNTNRGRRGHWSGFLSHPALLGAYTRHIEATLPVTFTGFNGFLLRRGWASYHKYWKKKYIEGIQ